MVSIKQRIEAVRERMEKAALGSGRDIKEIRLMGVSKFVPQPLIKEAIDAGLLLFGESRVQEAVDKFPLIKEKQPAIELHMIGNVQRNKVKHIPALFDMVESADRDALITALGTAMNTACQVQDTKPLDILLEFHTAEDSKSGYKDLDGLCRAAELALTFPELKLAGLMTMAPFTQDQKAVRASFRALYTAREKLQARFPQADFSCLSMGMSNDFETAIEEGSTLVRVGTALFGAQA